MLHKIFFFLEIHCQSQLCFALVHQTKCYFNITFIGALSAVSIHRYLDKLLISYILYFLFGREIKVREPFEYL